MEILRNQSGPAQTSPPSKKSIWKTNCQWFSHNRIKTRRACARLLAFVGTSVVTRFESKLTHHATSPGLPRQARLPKNLFGRRTVNGLATPESKPGGLVPDSSPSSGQAWGVDSKRNGDITVTSEGQPRQGHLPNNQIARQKVNSCA